VKVLLSQSENANSSFRPGQIQHCLKCSQPYLEFHVKVLLGQSEDADSSFRLTKVVVDADERFHCRLRAALVLMLLVVQRLGKGVALLC